MISIEITSPDHKHMQGGWDKATTPLLQGEPFSLIGNITWPTGTQVGIDGLPFKTLLLKVFERGFGGWVDVGDVAIDGISLVDSQTASFAHELTPNDPREYQLLLKVLDAATNVLSTATPLVIEAFPSN